MVVVSMNWQQSNPIGCAFRKQNSLRVIGVWSPHLYRTFITLGATFFIRQKRATPDFAIEMSE